MKILILDRQGLFLDAVQLFMSRVEPQIRIITASDLTQGAQLIRSNPDLSLILMDCDRIEGTQEGSAAAAINRFCRIRDLAPAVPLGIISEPLGRAQVEDFMRLGAAGYFPKGMRAEAFVQAVRLVLMGERFIPFETEGAGQYFRLGTQGGLRDSASRQSGYDATPQAALPDTGGRVPQAEDVRTARAIRLPSTDELVRLSSREIQILSHLGRGLANKDIARHYDIKEVTVKQHVRSILKKLKVRNRTEAALIARDLHL